MRGKTERTGSVVADSFLESGLADSFLEIGLAEEDLASLLVSKPEDIEEAEEAVPGEQSSSCQTWDKSFGTAG